MKKRPTSITVIAWILIVTAAISAISSTLTMNTPVVRDMMGRSLLPIPVQFAMLYAGLLVSLTSGIFLLRGRAWARILYVAWGSMGLLVSIVTSPMKAALIPGVVVFLVIVVFLFRPAANAFLSPASPPDDSQSL